MDKLELEIPIQNLSLKGYGLGPLPSGGEVEVAHTVLQDVVKIEWRKKRHPPQKGRLLEVLKPSPDRVEPRCAHARVCGGCSWQQMDYAAQLKEKERRVKNIFGVGAPIRPILGADSPFGYRNKMEFSFSENRGGQKFLGLMIAQAEPYVFNVTECHLGPPWFAEVVCAIRKWWEASKVAAYNPPLDTGCLRYVTLRAGMRTGEKMVVLNVSGAPEFAPSKGDLAAFVEAIQAVLPKEIPPAIFLRIHQTKKGRPTQFYEMHLSGPDHIVEELHLAAGKLSFKISPISFFQPNTFQAEKLYDAALSWMDPAQQLLDLYCGTGTLSLAASKRVKRVIGVELSAEAILDAEDNAKRNSIENVTFFQGDVGKVLTEKTLSPDVILLDPPRAGLDSKALDCVSKLKPKQIIYISCNPLTQAENIKELLKSGYRLNLLQPVDQFPHTYHIENIALLVR